MSSAADLFSNPGMQQIHRSIRSDLILALNHDLLI